MYPYVHCSVSYNSQDLEAAQVLIGREMDKKKAVVHLHNGYYSDIKRRKSYPLRHMDGPAEYDTKWSKSEKDKHHKISLIREI